MRLSDKDLETLLMINQELSPHMEQADITTALLIPILQELIQRRNIANTDKPLDNESLATALTDIYARLRQQDERAMCAMKLVRATLVIAQPTSACNKFETGLLLCMGTSWATTQPIACLLEKMRKPRIKPLAVTITRTGIVRIEIGVETLALSALYSPYAYKLMGPKQERPTTRFSISNARGFAGEVKHELLREAEDGSSILSDALDKACQQAIEDGSQFFIDKDEK